MRFALFFFCLAFTHSLLVALFYCCPSNIRQMVCLFILCGRRFFFPFIISSLAGIVYCKNQLFATPEKKPFMLVMQFGNMCC